MSAVTASQANNSTTKTFLTALVANGGLLAVEVGAFIILKQRLGRIYSPRTYLPPPECVCSLWRFHLRLILRRKRATELPKGVWKWLPTLLLSNAEDIVRRLVSSAHFEAKPRLDSEEWPRRVGSAIQHATSYS
jgi:calcium permeable stress-gated cation channel